MASHRLALQGHAGALPHNILQAPQLNYAIPELPSVTMPSSIKLLLAILLLAAGSLHAQTLNAPESLDYDAAAARYLISNRGAGQILARSSGGVLTLFTDDPSSPAGMEIVAGVVYVADGGFVRGYRLSDAMRVVNHPISGATFLNGIASDGGSRLWVTDFSSQRLHQLDIGDIGNVSHTTPITSTGFQPNGLWWDAAQQRLLMVSWGANARVFSWQPGQTSATLVVQTSFSNFDGIVRDCDGAVYISSWGASAVLRTPAPLTAQSVFTIFAPGQSSPADLAYAAELGEVAVPNAGNSTLSFLATSCVGVQYRDGFESG
jgi:hypothetical protein